MDRTAARTLPWLLVAALCGVAPRGAPAQASAAAHAAIPLDVQHYGLDEGLSQNSVTAIVQDATGFLWLGTQDGLNRFDSQGFRVLRESIDERAGLSSSSVDALAVDARGRLWIGTNDRGLDRLDLRTGAHEALGEAAAGHPTVLGIVHDGRGGAWLATPTGLSHLADGQRVATPLLRGPAMAALRADREGGGWALSTACELWRLSDDGVRPVALTAPTEARCAALALRGGDLLVATARHGVLQVSSDGAVRSAWRADTFGADDDLVSVGAFRDGTAWAGSASGRIHALPAAGTGAAPQRVRFRRSLGAAVTGFFEDADGGRWIATSSAGAYRVRPLSSVVRSDLLDLPDGIATRSVRSIWSGTDVVLVGTDAGLWVQRGGDAWQSVAALAGTAIRRIVAAPGAGWWVGTHRGLWRLEADLRARELALALPDPRLLDVHAHGDRLLVATRGGLAMFDGPERRPVRVPPMFDGLLVTTLRRDADGALWLATNERGAFRWPADGAIEHWHTGNGRLPHDSIWSLHGDADALWFGSFSGGLIRVDRRGGAVRRFTDRDGLSNNVIYRIEPDASGRLWLSTNAGLSVLDPATGTTLRIDRDDGLRNREYNSGASTRDADGRLLFGGIHGVDVVDPAALDKRTAPIQAAFARVRRLGPTSDGERGFDLLVDERLPIAHTDRAVALDLVALAFDAPSTAQVRYRMAGVLPDWVTPGRAQAEVLLTQLPAGRHVLEAQAAGRDGRFGPTRTLVLDVSPPPWRTPAAHAAYAALGVLAAGTLVIALRGRTRRKAAQIERLNAIVAARTAEIATANARLQAMNAQLQQLNRVDPLTRVANRREFVHWMERQAPRLLSSGAASRGALLFFMIDIDDFKRINDEHGHHAGDAVLVAFAARLEALRGPDDLLARWGGEEFLFAQRVDGLGLAAATADALLDAVRGSPVTLANGEALAVTCSIGFAPWPWGPAWPTPSDSEQSLRLADRALYRVKTSGKDGWAGLLPGPEADARAAARILAGDLDGWDAGVLKQPRSTPRDQSRNVT